MRVRYPRGRLSAGTLLLAVATLLFAPASARAADEIIDRVLAVVAGDVIMLSDVTAARELGLASPRAAADPVRDVLDQLIARSLILAEVDRYAPPEPTPEAVAEELRVVRNRFSSTENWDRALARGGLDVLRLSEMLRQNLRIRGYLDQRFSADTPADRQRLIDEWVAGLRRRSAITELDATAP